MLFICWHVLLENWNYKYSQHIYYIRRSCHCSYSVLLVCCKSSHALTGEHGWDPITLYLQKLTVGYIWSEDQCLLSVNSDGKTLHYLTWLWFGHSWACNDWPSIAGIVIYIIFLSLFKNTRTYNNNHFKYTVKSELIIHFISIKKKETSVWLVPY